MANTGVIIKRSFQTAIPGYLEPGELAYSYVSNVLFTGSGTGEGVVNIGGLYYTETLDAATPNNVANTLVRRDANGNFQGVLVGTANTADRLSNARTFSITGGDISASNVQFDGTSNVNFNASLNTIDGLTPGYYGGLAAVPVIQVAANGRIISVANTTSSSSFNIEGNTGSSLFGGGTLRFEGGSPGITTVESVNGTNTVVTFVLDNSVITPSRIANGSYTVSLDDVGALNLAGVGTIRNVPGQAVNIVSDNFAQLQWTTDVNNPDPNSTSNTTNWAYVGSGGFAVENQYNTGNTKGWYFNNDGTLTLPNTIIFADGTRQNSAFTGAAANLVNGPYTVNLDDTGKLNVPDTINFGENGGAKLSTSYFGGGVVLDANASAGLNFTLLNLSNQYNQNLGDIYLYYEGANTAAAYIDVNDGTTQRTFAFRTDGSLNTPGNITTPGIVTTDQVVTNKLSFKTGSTIYTGNNNTSDPTNYVVVSANINNDINGFQVTEGQSSQAIIYTEGDVVFYANTSGATAQWTFGKDKKTTFPDGSTLSDAYQDNGTTLRSSPTENYILLASNNLQQYVQVDDTAVYIGTNYAPGIPIGVANWNGQGGWNQGFYSDLATTGGTGTGLTVDVAAGGAGYITIDAITIHTPGTGYTNGDVITITNEYDLSSTFTLVVEGNNSWTFDRSGVTTFPGGATISNNSVITSDSFVGVHQNAGTGNQQVYLQGDGAFIQTSLDDAGATFYTWQYDTNGNLIFPDSTSQSTAFTGTAIDQYARDTANSATTGSAIDQYARDTANNLSSGSAIDQYARDTANSAINGSAIDQFARDRANTDVTTISLPGSSFGSSTQIPVIGYAANGRIISAGVASPQTGTGSLRGVVQLNDSVSSTSSVTGANAATPLAVKTTYDYAQAAFNQANVGATFVGNGGSVSGNVSIFGNLSVTGNISYTGNVTSVTVTGNTGQFFGYAANGFNAMYVGIPTGYLIEPQTVFQATGNYNGYAGINFQNINPGNLSSADYFITADNGTVENTFLDLGLASSTYNYPGYELIKPNDGYFLVYGNTITGGGNAIIATGATNDIVFATNGVNDSRVIMRITSSNTVLIKSTTPSTSKTTGALQVAGGIGTEGDIQAVNVYSQGTNLLSYNQGINNTQNTNITAVNTYATSAYDKANSANSLAQAAFNAANTDYTTINATPRAYGNSAFVPVITLAANGRVSSITNTAISVNPSVSVLDDTQQLPIVVYKSATTQLVTGSGNAGYIPTYQPHTGGMLAWKFNAQDATVGQAGISSLNNMTAVGNVVGGNVVTSNTVTANAVYANTVYSGGVLVLTSEPIGISAFNKANSANVLAQAAFDAVNIAAANTVYLQTVNNLQNTNITAVNTLAQSAFDKANTGDTLGQSAYTAANTAAANTVYLSSVNDTQNTNITAVNTLAQASFDKANTGDTLGQSAYTAANTAAANTVYLQTVNNLQNTNITAVNTFAASAYNTANTDVTSISLAGSTIGSSTQIPVIGYAANGRIISAGVASPQTGTGSAKGVVQLSDSTSSTLSVSGETAATPLAVKTTYDIASGAFNTANASLDLAQASFNKANTGDTLGQSAYTAANTASANTIYLQSVNDIQNTNITSVNTLAQSAYNTANTKLNITGGTVTGNISFTGESVALGNIANLHIYGGNTGQLLTTDNFGNLSFIDLPTPNTVTYTANSLIQTNGVYVSGNLWSTQVFGDYATGGAYVLTDGSGSSPAWYIDFDFINVVKFNRVVLNINYTQASGHTVYIQLYNYVTSAWDSIGTYTGLGSYYAFALEVIDEAAYVDSGNVQLRLYHSNSGNISHQTSIDYVALEQSIQGPQGPRGPTGATGATGATGPGVPSDGTNRQVLVKNSSTNYDTVWSNDLIDAWNTANASNILAQAGFNAANAGIILAQASFDSANIAAANTVQIQAVNSLQNTNITAVNTFASSAYNQANSANNLVTSAYEAANNRVLKTGDSITGNLTISSNVTSTRPNTGSLIVTGAVGVSDSIYVGNRVGFSNTSNISMVYQFYNSSTNSLDTVFG